jgi:hypothetical protein
MGYMILGDLNRSSFDMENLSQQQLVQPAENDGLNSSSRENHGKFQSALLQQPSQQQPPAS